MKHPFPDSSRALRSGLAGAAAAAWMLSLLVALPAQAQINQPGAHAHYSVELEPHGTLWWQDHAHYWDNGLGLGLGMRVSIPIVQDGFVPSINNSVAIGFGLDWGHFSHRCWWSGDRNLASDCTNNEFWVPVVLQWNFFLTKSFSVFAEPGLALRHSRWEWPNGYCGGPGGPAPCSYSNTDTGVEPVVFVGGRVGSDTLAFTFRLGWPYLSAGVSFML